MSPSHSLLKPISRHSSLTFTHFQTSCLHKQSFFPIFSTCTTRYFHSCPFLFSSDKTAAENAPKAAQKPITLTPSQLPPKEGGPLDYDFRIHAGKIIHSEVRTFKNRKANWSSKEAEFQQKIGNLTKRVINEKDDKMTLEKQLTVVRELSPGEVTPTPIDTGLKRTLAERLEEDERTIISRNIHRYNMGHLALKEQRTPFSEHEIETMEKYEAAIKMPETQKRIIENFRKLGTGLMMVIPGFFIISFICSIWLTAYRIYLEEKAANKKLKDVFSQLK